MKTFEGPTSGDHARMTGNSRAGARERKRVTTDVSWRGERDGYLKLQWMRRRQREKERKTDSTQ